MRGITYCLPFLLAFLGLLIASIGCAVPTASPLSPQPRLRVATTTSLYDTGLWGYLEPLFEEKYNIELDIVYAGTGKALEYGRRGDVDVITVHARAREEQFIAEGYGIQRIPFAYNYFLIVGPAADPADIKGMSSEGAFKKLMDTATVSFISRGDDSGTHAKEKSIWEKAGYDYEVVRNAGIWYVEAGGGMGPVLAMASEKQAYTLTDIGTYFTHRSRLELISIIDQGDTLLNVYSAIAVDPGKVPDVKINMANDLIRFLTSPETQEFIGEYGVNEYGMPLFTPYAGTEPK